MVDETFGTLATEEPGIFVPPPPQRILDAADVEGLGELIDRELDDHKRIKQRVFPELEESGLTAADVQVVLYDAYNIDSIAAAYAAQVRLGDSAEYVGIVRSQQFSDLEVEVTGRVVMMVGVCWPSDVMHDMIFDFPTKVIILESYPTSQRDLEEENNADILKIFDFDMSAATMAWNFFNSSIKMPALYRAIEDMELGRRALAFADYFPHGFQEEVSKHDIFIKGQISADDSVFDLFRDVLLGEDGGVRQIQLCNYRGYELTGEVQAEKAQAGELRKTDTLRAFPMWRFAWAEMKAKYSDSVAEHLARGLIEEVGEGGEQRCFGGVIEKRGKYTFRVILRSFPGGPDVGEIARWFGGTGRPTKAFFMANSWEFGEMFIKPHVVLWDVQTAAPDCLNLRKGDKVIVSMAGQRLPNAPHDEWSWGHKESDGPRVEGWLPTLSHTLFVAFRSTDPLDGVQALKEGDLVVATAQRGEYVWGEQLRTSEMGWFQRSDGALEPVSATSARAMMRMLKQA